MSSYLHLKSCLVPDCSIVECSWCCEEEHDGDHGVEDHGQHQGDQVEQGDVHEEHRNVHLRGARVLEVAFRNLRIDNFLNIHSRRLRNFLLGNIGD